MPTESKKWYTSKTIVSDLLTVLVALYIFTKHFVPQLPDLPPDIQASALAILGGVGIFGRVTATKPVGL